MLPELIVKITCKPAPFRFLVDAGVPFLMEKPWGVDDRTVNQLADLAAAKNAWAAVPMPFRYSWWAETARAMRSRGELGTISLGGLIGFYAVLTGLVFTPVARRRR